MSEPVTVKNEGNIAWIEIDNPPVNALGYAVRQGLVAAIRTIEADASVAIAIIIGQGRTFPAGADIREFGKTPLAPYLTEVVNRIELCTKPVIAAMHGTALGGGLEVALGAHYRIAAASARMGLPEVLLGVLPGAGGTQRLPRITGAGPALEIMTSGQPVGADAALKMGIIDRVAGDDLRAGATAYAQALVAQGAGPRMTRDRTEGLQDPAAFRAAIKASRAVLEKRARHLYAPFRILDCVAAVLDTQIDAGLDLERQAFMECLDTPQREGLIHAFFAERASARVPEADRAEPRALNTLGVVGGGTMGAGITVAALNAGFPVIMVERDADSIERGRANVEKVFDRLIARGRMDAGGKAAIMARYTGSTDYADLGDVDLVIEAVFERMDVKREVFAQLDKVIRPGAVMASNTSYLNIDDIASATTRPQDVIGLHFFSPANIMKLLEIVIPSAAADDAVATGFALARKLKKIPVRAGNSDGFIGNRIFRKYGQAAGHIMEDGASPYQIDRALVEFGYPMGIYAVYDLAGLDIGWANRKKDAANRNPKDRYVAVADRICEMGWFGQKTGRGFYRYEDGARAGSEDPEILAILDAERAKKGITRRDFTDGEIIRRYMAAMINEGAEVLRERVALKPSDIDVTFLYGYGFPRFRGGPMKYADMYGLDNVLADIREYAKEDPRFWRPSPLLVELVEKGETFDSLNRGG